MSVWQKISLKQAVCDELEILALEWHLHVSCELRGVFSWLNLRETFRAIDDDC